MSDHTIAKTLIHAAAIDGISVLWLEFTAEAFKKVSQRSKEMFADKGAEERKRQRGIDQEVRRKLSEIIGRKEEEIKRGVTEIIERRENELIRGLSKIIEREEEEEEEEAAGKTD